ncbi:conserved hypothetical protein [Sphingobium sp. SYK-6]|nr:conserved hypothetical protein [Sphingobium sp. SYK-6]
MPVRRDGADLMLAVRLTPRAARERIGSTFADAHGQRWLQVSVTAPPDKGRANAALIALLARRLRLPQSSILLETGDTNRLKRLRLTGADPGAEESLRDIAGQERSTA